MDYSSVLNSLLLSELKAREAFLRIAEYHKSEPGIYYDCQFMSSVSGDNLRIIKTLMSDHSLRVLLKKADFSSTSNNFNPGNNLIDDLEYLLRIKQDAESDSRIIMSSPDTTDKVKVEILIRNSNRQAEWLSDRIKQEEIIISSSEKKI